MLRIYCIVLLAFGFLDLKGQSLPIDEESGKITYQEVVELENISAKKLFFSGLKFYRSNFHVEDLTINDPDNYYITGPMSTSFQSFGKTMHVLFFGDLQFKEGRYRYIFSDLRVDTNGGGIVNLDKGFPFGMVGKKKITENVEISMNSFISTLEDYILKECKGDDW